MDMEGTADRSSSFSERDKLPFWKYLHLEMIKIKMSRPSRGLGVEQGVGDDGTAAPDLGGPCSAMPPQLTGVI